MNELPKINSNYLSSRAFAILNLVSAPGRITGGEILFEGSDLSKLSDTEMRTVRGDRISMIFQDPMMTLNPVLTVGVQMVETLKAHREISDAEAKRLSIERLREVAIPSPEARFDAYPHELSGGLRQRVVISIALLTDPGVIIADEPTTALDVTIQAQILALLSDLRKNEGLSILLITHDLGVVAETCDHVAVAYAGRIVESGTVEDVLYQTKHPYTQGLMAALPDTVDHGEPLQVIKGTVPDGLNPISGCPFHPRCPAVMDLCREQPPRLLRMNNAGHTVACHLYEEAS